MVWKSRENAYPKPDFLARLLAHLRLAYPAAELTEDVLRELWPFILSEWRHGKDERGVATSTCSCDGVRIVPSPGVQVALANRRIVRAPKGAEPNQVFGLAALRASSRVERLRLAMQIAQRKLQFKDEALHTLEAQLPRARSEKRTHDLQRRQQELRAEMQSLQHDLAQMQKDYAATIQGMEPLIEPMQTAPAPKRRAAGKKPRALQAAAGTGAGSASAAPKSKTPDPDTPADCACQTPGDAVPDVAEQELSGLLNTLAGGLDPAVIAGLGTAEGA